MAEKELFFLDPFALDPKQGIFSLSIQQNWNLSALQRALKANYSPYNNRSLDQIKVFILSQYLDYPHTPNPSKLVTYSANPTYNGISLAEFSPVEKILKRFPTVTEDNEQIQMIVYVTGGISSSISAPADLGNATLDELRKFHEYVGQNPMPSKALEFPPERLNTMDVDNTISEKEIPSLSDSMDVFETGTNAEETSPPRSKWAKNSPSSIRRSSRNASHLHRSNRDRERSRSPRRRPEQPERDYRDKETDVTERYQRRRSRTRERRRSASPERRRDDRATPPPIDNQNPDPMEVSGRTGVQDATGDLLPDPTFLQSPLFPKKLLVRADYLRIDKFIDDIYKNREGRPTAVVLTGQPGIGKTMWLHYAMYRRIQLGLPFIWYKAGKYYRFTKTGVYENVNINDFGGALPEPHWCFIDGSDAREGLPVSMAGTNCSGIFPIYVTSPKATRWSSLYQSKRLHCIVMNPWTHAEMELARCQAYPDMDPAEMKKRFDELGPTARLCLDYTETNVIDFLTNRDTAIGALDLKTLEAILKDPASSNYQMSHKIVLMRRLNNNPPLHDFRVEFMSEAVLRHLVATFQKRTDEDVAALWRLMSNVDKCGIPTGPVFELHNHCVFQKQIKLTLQLMVRKTSHLHQHSDTNSEVTVDFIPTKYGVYQKDEYVEVEEHVYYRPADPHQVAIDSFFIYDGILYLLQHTMGKTHGVKDGLLKFISKCLPRKFHDSNTWRFVFVIPDTRLNFSSDARLPGRVKFFTAQISFGAPKI